MPSLHQKIYEKIMDKLDLKLGKSPKENCYSNLV